MQRKLFLLFVFIFSSIMPSFAFNSDIEVINDKGIYIFKIPLKKYGDKIKPYVAPELTTTSDVFHDKDLNFKLVVNGGFFDVKTGLPVSEVIIDGENVQSLYDNPELASKLNKQNRLRKVLNRSELRITKNEKEKLSYNIVNHFAAVKNDETILHSIQAGPMILPKLCLEEESFIKTKDNKVIQIAADVLKRRERTIIGLKRGILGFDYLYIVIFTNENKAALNEVKDYCLKLGLNKALAMDGGASTSINYKDIEIYSSNDSQRRVKSFLVIEN